MIQAAYYRTQTRTVILSVPFLMYFMRQGGTDTIMHITNFNAKEFQIPWNSCAPFKERNWNVGRGRKSLFTIKEVLFMLLSVLKNGGNWDFLGCVFKMKGPTFERLIAGYLKMLSKHAYTSCVEDIEKTWPMFRVSRKI